MTEWTPQLKAALGSVPAQSDRIRYPVAGAEHGPRERIFTRRKAWTVWARETPPKKGDTIDIGGLSCLVETAEYLDGQQIVLLRVWAEDEPAG